MKVAIIGLGVVGLRRKIFIDKNNFIKLTAISDIKFKEKFFTRNKVHYYRNYNDLINNENLDAVFITLPNYLAAKVTITCLKKNLHVFCEKPPARSLSEIRKVKKIKLTKKNLILKYGFNHRYHSSIKIAKKISDSKKFGKIINFRCVYGKSKIKTFEVGDWRSKRKYSGGGILLDQGIHMIDLILYFSGNFSEFISYISNKYWNYDVEDNAFVLMRNKKGVVASLHSTATQWQHKFSMEITFQHGFIDLKGILSGTKSYGKESITIIPKYDVKKNGKGKKLFFSKDNSWKDEVDEFVKLIFYKRKKYVGNIYEAENVMFTLDKIYRSDKKWFKYLKKKNFNLPNFLPKV